MVRSRFFLLPARVTHGSPRPREVAGIAVAATSAMPDLWTTHPDIVRDLLEGDLYVHHVDRLRSELPATEAVPAGTMTFPDSALCAAALLTGLIAGMALRRCRARVSIRPRSFDRRR